MRVSRPFQREVVHIGVAGVGVLDRTHPSTVDGAAEDGRWGIRTGQSRRPILADVDERPLVVLTLHGVAHSDDLGVQAFARHLATAAGTGGQPIIAGMRAFLEHRPQLAAPPWSTPPPTGYAAVEALAAAAGCTPEVIAHARGASRADLAGSAWILDPADGLPDLLELAVGRADVMVVAEPDDPATGPVLDALDLADRVTLTAAPPAGRPALVIDAAWTPNLAAARAAGQATALLDRFGTGDARPDLRAADLPGLLPGITAWLDRTLGGPA